MYVVARSDTTARPLARADLRVLSAMVLAIAGLMLAAGTVVTGTGPLAGNAAAPRYHLPLKAVTQLHADIGWLFGGLALTLAVGLKLRMRRPGRSGLAGCCSALLAVQGALGYIQYFTGLPPLLVGMHVLGVGAHLDHGTAVVLRAARPWQHRDRADGPGGSGAGSIG